MRNRKDDGQEPIIIVDSREVHTAAYQEQITNKSTPTVHPVKKCETTSDAQIFFLASLFLLNFPS